MKQTNIDNKYIFINILWNFIKVNYGIAPPFYSINVVKLLMKIDFLVVSSTYKIGFLFSFALTGMPKNTYFAYLAAFRRNKLRAHHA